MEFCGANISLYNFFKFKNQTIFFLISIFCICIIFNFVFVLFCKTNNGNGKHVYFYQQHINLYFTKLPKLKA